MGVGIGIQSAESSPPRKILELLTQGKFELATSPILIDEFVEIMERHNLQKSITQKWLKILKRTRLNKPPYVRHIEPINRIDAIAVDPDDNRLLECADEGQADYIVTGDKHLLKLGRFQNIAILSPRDFLDRLGKEAK